MSERTVTIVTDGSIELSLEAIRQLGIVIAPRHTKVGGKVYESSEAVPLLQLSQTVGRGAPKVDFLAPSFSDFVATYRRVTTPAIISIHAPTRADDAFAPARIAKRLLSPTVEIDVFEAKSLDAGVAFLVLVAAQAALEGRTKRQVLLLLRRLQDELMQSYFVVTDLRRWNHAIPPRDGRKLSLRLFGGASMLFSVDRRTGEFVTEAQENAFNPHLLQRVDTYARGGTPFNVWVRQRGFEAELQQLQAYLANRYAPQQFIVETGGLGTTRFFGNRFAEVVLHPSFPEVERIKHTLQRWERYMAEGGTVDGSDKAH